MTNLKNILIIGTALASLFGGLFIMSALAETIKPGSWTQVLTTAAYGAAVIVAMVAAGVAVFGFMYVAWRQAVFSRHIIEIQTERGPRYYAEYPVGKNVSLLDLSGEDVKGVEISDAHVHSPRVRRVPEGQPTFVRANLAFPTALHDSELIHEFHRPPGGNGK